MSDEKDEIKEYAGGWITEKKGTDAPAFLKAAFIIVPTAMLVYLFVYMNGETFHSERGVLVETFNKATGTANGFMYFVAFLILVFTVTVVTFAFRKFKD